MKSVAGKTVLVTGAARGMGRLFVERAIAERARRVILWDVDEAALAAPGPAAEVGPGNRGNRQPALRHLSVQIIDQVLQVQVIDRQSLQHGQRRSTRPATPRPPLPSTPSRRCTSPGPSCRR